MATLLLRSVDPILVLKKYLSGDYKSLKLPKKTKLESKVVVVETNIGTNFESEIYEYIDWSNSRRRIATTNHEQYAIVRDRLNNNPKLEQFGELPETKIKICHWCRRRDFKQPIVGLPIRMEYQPNKHLFIFSVTMSFCSFGCAYALVQKEMSAPCNIRDSTYTDAETLLLRMFGVLHPGKKLVAAPDWKLLQLNGGPLRDEDFDSNHYHFRITSNIIMLPIKQLYSQTGPLS